MCRIRPRFNLLLNAVFSTIVCLSPVLLVLVGNYAWSTRAIVAGGSPWLKVDS